MVAISGLIPDNSYVNNRIQFAHFRMKRKNRRDHSSNTRDSKWANTLEEKIQEGIKVATPSATPRHTHQSLPLLPSRPGGVHNLALRGNQKGHHNRLKSLFSIKKRNNQTQHRTGAYYEFMAHGDQAFSLFIFATLFTAYYSRTIIQYKCQQVTYI